MMVDFSVKRSCLKRIRGTRQGRKEEEVGTLLLGNDIVNYLLSYLSKGLFKVKDK